MNQNQPPSNPSELSQILNKAHEGRLNTLIETCVKAGQHTLKYFCDRDLDVEAKSDDSPVTIADREAEELARKLVSKKHENDTLQGEEFSDQVGTSPYRWIVDPIDGTKSFICGVPLYSTLIAIEKDDEALAGAIYIPATGEMVFAANQTGCWHRKTDETPWARCQVSDKSVMKSAVFLTSQADLFRKQNAGLAYQTLEDQSWVSRSWGDGYGYLMVATGRAEIMVDAVCNAWDVAAMIPILREAGGQFTDWKGNTTPRGGNGVGTNGKLHAEVLKTLQVIRD